MECHHACKDGIFRMSYPFYGSPVKTRKRADNVMKLQQLQVFIAVAREKSLRAASRQLNLAQPSVTRIIHELEEDLGVELFNRSVRGVDLTEFGEALQRRASQVLEDLQRAREELVQIRGNMLGRVAFGATSSIALTLLPATIKRFRQKAPDAELILTEVNFRQSMHRLRDGTLDLIASHVQPGVIDDDVLHSIPLLNTDFVIMARTGHPLANARTLADLLDAEWITPIASDRSQTSNLNTAYGRAGLPLPKRITYYTSFAIALGLVCDTDMLGWFSRPLAARIASYGLQQIPIEMPLNALQMSVVVRKNHLLTPVARHFMECLQESALEVAKGLPRNN